MASFPPPSYSLSLSYLPVDFLSTQFLHVKFRRLSYRLYFSRGVSSFIVSSLFFTLSFVVYRIVSIFHVEFRRLSYRRYFHVDFRNLSYPLYFSHGVSSFIVSSLFFTLSFVIYRIVSIFHVEFRRLFIKDGRLAPLLVSLLLLFPPTLFCCAPLCCVRQCGCCPPTYVSCLLLSRGSTRRLEDGDV